MKLALPGLSALALTLALSAPGLAPSPAAAQDMSPDMGMTMGMALTMLELSAQRELARIGLQDVDVTSLTLGQLSAIRVTTNTDGMDQSAQADQVRRIVGLN